MRQGQRAQRCAGSSSGRSSGLLRVGIDRVGGLLQALGGALLGGGGLALPDALAFSAELLGGAVAGRGLLDALGVTLGAQLGGLLAHGRPSRVVVGAASALLGLGAVLGGAGLGLGLLLLEPAF